ncbi:MAG: CCA tRNA nucleotidyltransferase [Anaerosomatales bacterium]|nr:CCA tRNA nucleotidyltransferase [Anaerosomatales bacterium]MDT8434791.1 CCA tRNA nucleotidyltransferase [Anaerosomatales bacterium]
MDSTFLASVPEPVLAIGSALHERGRDAVLVGGAVRDALLGVASADWDLVTDAPAGEVRAVAGHTAGVRSLYDVGKRFGTLGIALEGGGTLEVSPYRAEAAVGATLTGRFAADAALRDFTVNAIGVDLATGALLDPVGGRADLAGRVLQAPGDPRERFAEDPLRVIRAARFVAELGFELEAATRDALPGAATALKRIAPERVREELTRLLVAPFAPRGLEVLHENGALAVVLPEVAALDGVTQPTFHDLDVLAHTIQAVGLVPATPVLRWATLLHDIGKPPTRTVQLGGRIRFFGHAQEGARTAAQIVSRLRFSTADAAAIVHLVGAHMHFGEIELSNPKSVDRAVRKLDLRLEESAEEPLVSAEDVVALTVADFGATAHREQTADLREALEDAVATSRERGTHRPVVLPITGGDIMRAFGLAEGPAVGVAKDAVEDAVERGGLAPDDVEGAYVVAGAALEAFGGGAAGREADPPDDESGDLTSSYRTRRVLMGVVSLVVIVALLLLVILGVARIVPRQRQAPPSPVRMADVTASKTHA